MLRYMRKAHYTKACLLVVAVVVKVVVRGLTPPLSSTLALERCRQIHMWRVRGFTLGSPPEGRYQRWGLANWSYAKTTCWDRVASGIAGKLAGLDRWPLAAHLGEGKLSFQTPAVLLGYPLVEKTSGEDLVKKSGVEPLKAA